MLIQDCSHEARYLLLGSGCDPGDRDWTATLIRECAEESQVTIIPATVIYLGHQVVTGDPGVSGTYVQVRLFVVIGAFEPVAPDPDTGQDYRRLMGRGGTVAGMLPPWDGACTVNRLLPEWALALTRSCGDRYAFSTMQVWEGRDSRREDR